MDQAEQDIEQLAIKASMGFIKFYDSFSQVSIGKAIRTVEGLLQKLSVIGKENPNGKKSSKTWVVIWQIEM